MLQQGDNPQAANMRACFRLVHCFVDSCETNFCLPLTKRKRVWAHTEGGMFPSGAWLFGVYTSDIFYQLIYLVHSHVL